MTALLDVCFLCCHGKRKLADLAKLRNKVMRALPTVLSILGISILGGVLLIAANAVTEGVADHSVALVQANNGDQEATLPSEPSPGAAASTVDGAVNPELIPDSTAYRLYFLVVALRPGATLKDEMRQVAHFQALGIPERDRLAVKKALSSFAVQYHELIGRYNRDVDQLIRTGKDPE